MGGRVWSEDSSDALISGASRSALTPLLSLPERLDHAPTTSESGPYTGTSWSGRQERWPTDPLTMQYGNTASNVPDLPTAPESQSQHVSPAVSNHSTQTPSNIRHELQNSGVDQADSATFIGRAHYIDDDTPVDEQSARSYPTNKINELSRTGMTVLELFKSFEVPPRSVRQSLMDNFLKYCHPWTPILSRGDLEISDKRVPSLLLMQALFLTASRISSSSANPVFATPEQFYQRAKALFYMNAERDPITVIQSTIMLQWYTPDGPEHVSYDSGEFWLKIGVGIAFQVGLHREPNPGPNSATRRRIWWSLVVSFSHWAGLPFLTEQL